MKNSKILIVILFAFILNQCTVENDNITVRDCDKCKAVIGGEVKICNQVWMTKNLDIDHYRNGDSIPEVRDAIEWANLTTGAWCYYNNDPENGCIYGKLYNWYAVVDPRGLAPVGWHIPRDVEWTELVNCLGGNQVAGGKLKEKGVVHWIYDFHSSTNESGFTALPAGTLHCLGPKFYSIGSSCYFWSLNEESFNSALARVLRGVSDTVQREAHYKYSGMSIRCIKD